MRIPHQPSAEACFESELDVSVSKLLSMLRRNLDMDVVFVSKFEQGYRKSVFVDAKKDIESDRFSHPFDETYCKKIVDGELPEVIPDARLNEITRRMAVTEELSIGAYVGVPICLSDGGVYGTLCCFKHVSDSAWEKRDASLLRFIAELIADTVENYRTAEVRGDRIRGRIDRLALNHGLAVHLQPIWSVRDDKVCGYEALARFQTDPYMSPDIWFRDAEEVGRSEYLERMSIDRALGHLKRLPEHCFLSINASPQVILSGQVSEAIAQVDPRRLVLEVTEHARIRDYSEFRHSMKAMRAEGLRLAIDDAGSGYASFQHVLELDPDVIKLDMQLIRGIHNNVKKQALAQALIAYARQLETMVVAEGVECQDEFDTLKTLDVDKIQGFYIGKPAAMA